jgi:hypothetical protein
MKVCLFGVTFLTRERAYSLQLLLVLTNALLGPGAA